MPVFGISYRIVGSADCPYFARCERLAELLKMQMHLQVNARDIQIESVSPTQWQSTYSTLCKEYNFLTFSASAARLKSPDRVLVYHPYTHRLVGGEKEFRKEIENKYGVKCDLSWGVVQSIAAENARLWKHRTEAKSMQKLARPLIISVLGQPGAGKTTVTKRIEKKYGVVRIHPEEIVRLLVTKDPDLDADQQPIAWPDAPTLTEAETSVIQSHLTSGRILPDSILLPILLSRLTCEDVKQRGAVLDAWPATPEQAEALRTMEEADSEIGGVTKLIVLSDLSQETLHARLEGRRIDPASGEIYHIDSLPTDSLVLERLISTDSTVLTSFSDSTRDSLRRYSQHATLLQLLFRDCLSIISAESEDRVWNDVNSTLNPISERIIENHKKAAEVERVLTKAQIEVARNVAPPIALQSPTPISTAVPTPATRSTATPPTQSPSSSRPPIPHHQVPTPESVAAASVVAIPVSLSRRSSLSTANTTTATTAASPTIRPISISRQGSIKDKTVPPKTSSRRSSAVRFSDPIEQGASSPQHAAASVTPPKGASRRSSGLRSGVAKDTTGESSSPKASVAVTSTVPPAEVTTSPTVINRRISLRRSSSSRTSSGTGIVLPEGTVLKNTPADATNAASSEQKVSSRRASRRASRPVTPEKEKAVESKKKEDESKLEEKVVESTEKVISSAETTTLEAPEPTQSTEEAAIDTSIVATEVAVEPTELPSTQPLQPSEVSQASEAEVAVASPTEKISSRPSSATRVVSLGATTAGEQEEEKADEKIVESEAVATDDTEVATERIPSEEHETDEAIHPRQDEDASDANEAEVVAVAEEHEDDSAIHPTQEEEENIAPESDEAEQEDAAAAADEHENEDAIHPKQDEEPDAIIAPSQKDEKKEEEGEEETVASATEHQEESEKQERNEEINPEQEEEENQSVAAEEHEDDSAIHPQQDEEEKEQQEEEEEEEEDESMIDDAQVDGRDGQVEDAEDEEEF